MPNFQTPRLYTMNLDETIFYKNLKEYLGFYVKF